MAVVSISRIQIRRGQKNQGSGLPQLASGELGWAIDTRELYIGNGSVAEGAPAVGNTKVLTEYDDIFTLANTYSYRQADEFFLTGVDSSTPVNRSLQERLDDRVSVRAFGVKGDGVTDDTNTLQRAIDQLYLNEATKNNPESRVVLHLEAGVYRISDSLYIPPYATLRGAGSEKTIIRQTENWPVLKTVNSTSEPGSPADQSSSSFHNQPQSITISGLTLEQTSNNSGLLLESCRDSEFRDVKITGEWSAGSTISETNTGVKLDSLSGAVESSSNVFEECKIEKFSYGVVSNWDIEHNKFVKCSLRNLGYGVVFGGNMTIGDPGQQVGPSHTTIKDCVFQDINRQGIWVENGEYNLSSNNRFVLVGTNAGSEINAGYPVILYKTSSNKSTYDYFARTEALISGTAATVPYVPEIDGTAMYELNYEHEQQFGNLNNTRLFRLPSVQNQSYQLDYTIISNTSRYIRSGVMTVIVDAISNNVDISDNYDVITEGDIFENRDIQFTGQIVDADSDGEAETINVRVTNTLENDSSVIKFTVKAKKTDTP